MCFKKPAYFSDTKLRDSASWRWSDKSNLRFDREQVVPIILIRGGNCRSEDDESED